MSAQGDDELGDTLAVAGELEADLGAVFDQSLASIDPRARMTVDGRGSKRPEMMFIRHELQQAKQQTLAVRRTALKNLLLKDFIQEDCELRNLGLAYAPRNP